MISQAFLIEAFLTLPAAFKSKGIDMAPPRSLILFNGKLICHRASRTQRRLQRLRMGDYFSVLGLNDPRVMQSCRTLRLSLCFPVCLMRTPLDWQRTG